MIKLSFIFIGSFLAASTVKAQQYIEEEAKVHTIVSFLAMLELVREGIIDVVQNSSFGDIEINKQELANGVD